MAKILKRVNDSSDTDWHLEGSSMCGHETACGYVDTFSEYIEGEGAPTCAGCIDVAKTAVKTASKAEILKWKGQP